MLQNVHIRHDSNTEALTDQACDNLIHRHFIDDIIAAIIFFEGLVDHISQAAAFTESDLFIGLRLLQVDRIELGQRVIQGCDDDQLLTGDGQELHAGFVRQIGRDPNIVVHVFDAIHDL